MPDAASDAPFDARARSGYQYQALKDQVLQWIASGTLRVGDLMPRIALAMRACGVVAALTLAVSSPSMLVVHPSLPAKTVKEYIALARAQPGKIVYGSSGSGSFVHLGMALLNSMSNTQMVHVPFKGGGPAVVALASGEIQAMTATIGSVIPHLPGGRLRALGVTSATRMKQFPDVPAIAEGLPGYEFAAWIGAFVASATPKPIVERLNAEMKKALDNPEVVKVMSGQTLDPMYLTSEQFAARLKADFDKYEKLVKMTGVTAN